NALTAIGPNVLVPVIPLAPMKSAVVTIPPAPVRPDLHGQAGFPFVAPGVRAFWTRGFLVPDCRSSQGNAMPAQDFGGRFHIRPSPDTLRAGRPLSAAIRAMLMRSRASRSFFAKAWETAKNQSPPLPLAHGDSAHSS